MSSYPRPALSITLSGPGGFFCIDGAKPHGWFFGLLQTDYDSDAGKLEESQKKHRATFSDKKAIETAPGVASPHTKMKGRADLAPGGTGSVKIKKDGMVVKSISDGAVSTSGDPCQD